MSTETILIVDENRQVTDFLANELLQKMGFATLVAHTGNAALAFVRRREVSLMLLDLHLPDINGLDLLRQLARERRSVPTILVTAHGSEQVAVDAFHLGVHDYLIKPVTPDRVNEAISRALGETRLRQEKVRLTAQLKEQVSWLMVLTKVGNSVTSTLEPDDVLRRIVDAGVQLTQADEGFLALLDEESGQLYLRAVKNIEDPKIKTMRLPVSDSMLGSVMRALRPLRSVQASDSSPLKVSTGYLVYSLLHVPIISRGKALGVLSVDNRATRRSFKEIDEAMLLSLADYAAIALENASLYQQAQQEIIERKRAVQAMSESEERYELAMRGAKDGLWDWDLKNNRVYYSQRWKSMLGYREDEIGTSPEEWFNRVYPEDYEKMKLEIANHLSGLTSHLECEQRIQHKDGTYHWMLARGLAVWDFNGTATRMAGSQTDITDRKTAEHRLLHDAFHDTLTDLPNRALFMDRLRYAVERAKRRESYLFAVLYLDLDRFKDVNDSLGHMMGDQLLVETSQRLSESLRPTDTVARLGGDEFVLLLEDISNIGDATRVAERVQKKLTSTFRVDGHLVHISASIGIVLSLTGYQRAEDVLRDADIAMYRAKAMGKARYEIFDPAMRDRIMERLTLETQLRRALENQELRVYYQPIVSLENGRLTGVEALVRWQHPERGLIYPADFIPTAEETGLIIPLDRWVMAEACRQMRQWQQEIPVVIPLNISVNISGKQVAQPDLVETIRHILEETGLDGNLLKLEITESAIMENDEFTAEVFARLQELGVQIQIDDFGIGYSSLSYLPRFPLNALKIAQSFVRRMEEDSSLYKIVQSIIMLTHGLGMGVIAEGVETKEQLARLRALGCEYGQGYLVSAPIESSAMSLMLAERLGREIPFPPWSNSSNTV